jgi:hypothetical protein
MSFLTDKHTRMQIRWEKGKVYFLIYARVLKPTSLFGKCNPFSIKTFYMMMMMMTRTTTLFDQHKRLKFKISAKFTINKYISDLIIKINRRKTFSKHRSIIYYHHHNHQPTFPARYDLFRFWFRVSISISKIMNKNKYLFFMHYNICF